MGVGRLTGVTAGWLAALLCFNWKIEGEGGIVVCVEVALAHEGIEHDGHEGEKEGWAIPSPLALSKRK